MPTLKQTMRLNAAFSTLTGGFMLLNARSVSAFMGMGPSWIYVLTGVGLLIFGADLVYSSMTHDRTMKRAVYFSLADISWVLGTVVLLVVQPAGLRTHGMVTVVLIAGVVGLFAYGQLKGYRSLKRAASASTSDRSSSNRT